MDGRRERELEREGQAFARGFMKEFKRAQQQQAERERWDALSPQERKKEQEQAAEAERQAAEQARKHREWLLEDEREHRRQSYGGSLDSWHVTLTEIAWKSFLYGALLFAALSYTDLYRWIHRGGDFPSLCRCAGPFICLCLLIGSDFQARLKRIYDVFGKTFSSYKRLLIVTFSGPAVALSVLTILGWLIDWPPRR